MMKAIGEAALAVLVTCVLILAVAGVIAIVEEFTDRHYQGVCHGAGYSGSVYYDGGRYCFIVDSECPSVVLLEDLEKEVPRGQ